MALAANSPVFGRPLKVLKHSVNNCSSGDVIPGCCGLLLSASRKFVFFAKFQNLTTNFLLLFFPFYRYVKVLFHLFPRKSLNHVMNQSKKQTLSLITVVCCCGVRLGQVFPNFSGHVPLQYFVI